MRLKNHVILSVGPPTQLMMGLTLDVEGSLDSRSSLEESVSAENALSELSETIVGFISRKIKGIRRLQEMTRCLHFRESKILRAAPLLDTKNAALSLSAQTSFTFYPVTLPLTNQWSRRGSRFLPGKIGVAKEQALFSATDDDKECSEYLRMLFTASFDILEN
ncbi:hypothetical protein KIN20_028543 [Parelaphostrongylus tenuis]|uniref:Uncharacterized protein n=1 Tax=Parelaphostrongylus tenuis TaxID=148309 RepID=A0AAD5R1B2_PARTN|nr:hypothetical protein KIN20_028543 [Parelaphostrongylus tenuis]